MELYTSYYARVSRANTDGYALIRISASMPKWFTKEIFPCSDLYPDWKLLTAYKNGQITEEEYTAEYMETIKRKSKQSILDGFEAVCKVKGVDKIILVCWEGPHDFCHRHLAGNYLDENCVEWEGN